MIFDPDIRHAGHLYTIQVKLKGHRPMFVVTEEKWWLV